MIKTAKQVKRIIIAAIGFTVLLIGLLLVVLPGPALIIIPVGLGILATQFVWARRLLKKITEQAKKVKTEFKNKVGYSGRL
jgi:tellurite resistance protein TerC